MFCEYRPWTDPHAEKNYNNIVPLVTVALSDKPWRRHATRSVKYIAEQRGHWLHVDRQDRAGYLLY